MHGNITPSKSPKGRGVGTFLKERWRDIVNPFTPRTLRRSSTAGGVHYSNPSEGVSSYPHDDPNLFSPVGLQRFDALAKYVDLCAYVERRLTSGISFESLIPDPEDQLVFAFIIYLLRLPVDARTPTLYEALVRLRLSPRVFHHFDSLPLEYYDHLADTGSDRELRYILRLLSGPFSPPGEWFEPFRKYLSCFRPTFPSHYLDGTLLKPFFEELPLESASSDYGSLPNSPSKRPPLPSVGHPTNPIGSLPDSPRARAYRVPTFATQDELPLYPKLRPLPSSGRRLDLGAPFSADTSLLSPIPGRPSSARRYPDLSGALPDPSAPAELAAEIALAAPILPDSPPRAPSPELQASPPRSPQPSSDDSLDEPDLAPPDPPLAMATVADLVTALQRIKDNPVAARATLFPATASFDGTDKSITFSHWQKFKQYVEFQNSQTNTPLAIQELIKLFALTLAPPASTWFQGEVGIDSIDELEKRFTEYYSPWGSTKIAQEKSWSDLKLNLMTDHWDAWIANFDQLATVLGKSPDEKKVKLLSVLPPFLQMFAQQDDDFQAIKKKVKSQIPQYRAINTQSAPAASSSLALLHSSPLPAVPLPVPPTFQNFSAPPDSAPSMDDRSLPELAKTLVNGLVRMASSGRSSTPSPNRRNNYDDRRRGRGGNGFRGRGRGSFGHRSRSMDHSRRDNSRRDNRGYSGRNNSYDRGGQRNRSFDSPRSGDYVSRRDARGARFHTLFSELGLDEPSNCPHCMAKEPDHDPLECPISGPLLRTVLSTGPLSQQ